MEWIQVAQMLPGYVVVLGLPALALMYTARMWSTSASERATHTTTMSDIAVQQTKRNQTLSDDLLQSVREVSTLKESVADLTRRLITVELDLAKEQAKNANYEALKVEVATLRQRVTDLQAELATEREIARGYEVENNQLRERVASLSAKIQLLEKQVIQLKQVNVHEADLIEAIAKGDDDG